MTSLKSLGPALRVAAVFAANVIGVCTASAASGSTDFAIPVTVDKSCEFGDIVFQDEPAGEKRRNMEEWTNLLLTQAAKHCDNGSKFSITRRTASVRAHDVFQVAALLCQRPDIKESSVDDTKAPWKTTLTFTCTVTKLDDIRAKVARGEQPFNWKTDRVAPRPTDEEERGRRAMESQPVQASTTPSVKPPVDPKDCSVAANMNTNYCKSLFLPGIR